jgi:4-carboxymuconolactone decarboxylase
MQSAFSNKENTMTKKTIELGGRIPLSAPASLSPNQQSLYQAINEQAVPWAEASGFVAKLEDGSLIGPFNVALQSPEIGAAFWRLQGIEAKNTTLNERVRQVVILTVGSAWESAYELYAHRAVARKAGLSEEAVVALAKGEQVPGLTEEEKLAQSLTKQLALEHQVPQETFDQAKAMFGIRGIVDMLFLAGCYDMVCSLLNTFEVPVPGNQSNEDKPAPDSARRRSSHVSQ